MNWLATCHGIWFTPAHLLSLIEPPRFTFTLTTPQPHENPQRTHPQLHPQPAPRSRCPVIETARRDLR